MILAKRESEIHWWGVEQIIVLANDIDYYFLTKGELYWLKMNIILANNIDRAIEDTNKKKRGI